MIFSVSNDGIEWPLEYGPDSVTMAVHLVQEMTKSSKEFTLAAWSLLLSRRQDFSNNDTAWVPITPKQEGTKQMKDEVLLSVGAQDMDTSGYQVSDLDVFEFYWENDQLAVDTVFRPGIYTTFSLSTFNDLEMGSLAETLILVDEEEEKDSPPPAHPTTTVSKRPTQFDVLMRNRPFGKRIEKLPN